MNSGDVLQCTVDRIDDRGNVWVKAGELIGLVAARDQPDVPVQGSLVNVAFLFLTHDDGTLGFSFVGSIRGAYPEKHPINFVDDSIIGSRFESHALPFGKCIAVKHPCGLFGLLPRDEFDQQIFPDTKVTVETVGIDRKHKLLIVRPIHM